jgi:hypothetical protein
MERSPWPNNCCYNQRADAVRTMMKLQLFLTFMLRLLAAIAIILALLAMVQGPQRQFTPLLTRPMPAVLIP